jgi:hypothetical protein
LGTVADEFIATKQQGGFARALADAAAALSSPTYSAIDCGKTFTL